VNRDSNTAASGHAHRYGTADDTTWPVDVGDLEWALRNNPDSLTREDQQVLASVVHAYLTLINPRTTHGDAVASLRRARKAAGRE
jgi:hypothetical protein